MIKTIKKNKKAIFAFVLSLVMLIGIFPFSVSVAYAVEVSPTAEGVQNFERDFTLELVNTKNYNNERHNMTYTTGNGWNTVKSSILPAGAFACTDSSVVCLDVSQGKYDITLAADQASAERLSAADVMVAFDANVDAAGDALELNFCHVFAKVTFQVQYASEYASIPNVTEIKFQNSTLSDKAYIYEAYSNLTTVFENENVVSAITGYLADNKIEFIVGTGSIPADTEILTFTADDKELKVKVKEDMVFEAGKNYTFNLKVGKDKVEITPIISDSTNIGNPWENGWSDEVNLDGTVEIIGTSDVGKTTWEENDSTEIIFSSEMYGLQTAALIYDGAVWSFPADTKFYYLENEMPAFSVVYSLKGNPGLSEYLKTDCVVENEIASIHFTDTKRTYSRLRVVGEKNKAYSVRATGFIPAGITEEGTYSYDVITDENGNAFLYGIFLTGASVVIMADGTEAGTYCFTTVSEVGKSYVLQIGVDADVPQEQLEPVMEIEDISSDFDKDGNDNSSEDTYVSEEDNEADTSLKDVYVDDGGDETDSSDQDVYAGDREDETDSSDQDVYASDREDEADNSGRDVYVDDKEDETVESDDNDDD